MAIAFARLQYVKRSAGQNACHKAAYNGRTKVYDERIGKTFNYTHKGDSAHHEILLPEGADVAFKNAQHLWGKVELAERRMNSQVAREMVFALPDDACITLDDRIEMTRLFLKEHFVDKGLAVQFDIHAPHEEEDHNWHAHVLMPTRRFTENGKELGEKARDMEPQVRNGSVVEYEEQRWGELWKAFQNDYFLEKGIDLQVDENGIIPQAHLGPVRLRARVSEMMLSHIERQSANENLSQDPSEILQYLTAKSSIIDAQDVQRYIQKHVAAEHREAVREAFWNHEGVVQLPKGETKYTSRIVQQEEERIHRITDRIAHRDGLLSGAMVYETRDEIFEKYDLSEEQKNVFDACLNTKRLVCVQGRAGTGKSHVMSAVREMYESQGCRVRGLAPSSSVAQDLKDKGFRDAQNLHRFLFQQNNHRDFLQKGEVLMVDEAAMVGNSVMQELLHLVWRRGAQVLMFGDDRQLPSVERGGQFKAFCEKYRSTELTEVRRQEIDWQKAISEGLSKGDVRQAVEKLESNGRIHWADTKEDSMAQIVSLWKKHKEQDFLSNPFIIEHRNKYAYILNEMIRNARKENGELSGQEHQTDTLLGTCYISQGDRIQFRENNRYLHIINGLTGTVTQIKEGLIVVETDHGKEVSFNPKTFHGYQLGYAGTYHQSQGKTVEKTYALHSPYTNKNLFYVGLTRQKNDIHYFVSKDEVHQRDVGSIDKVSQAEPYLGMSKYKEVLIQQLEREISKENVLRYSLPRRESMAKRILNYVKDWTHENRDFYRVDQQRKVSNAHSVSSSGSASPTSANDQSAKDFVQTYRGLENEQSKARENLDYKTVNEIHKKLESMYDKANKNPDMMKNIKNQDQDLYSAFKEQEKMLDKQNQREK